MKLRAPIRVLPRRWRQRYGDEVADMFEHSENRLQDWLDIVRAGSVARLEECMRILVIVGLAASMALSLVALGYALAELDGGLSETPRHWWSTAPATAFLISATVAWMLLLSRSRSGGPSKTRADALNAHHGE